MGVIAAGDDLIVYCDYDDCRMERDLAGSAPSWWHWEGLDYCPRHARKAGLRPSAGDREQGGEG